MRIVGDEMIDILKERIEHHEKCRNAYMGWNVPMAANQFAKDRRQEVIDKHTREPIEYEAGGHQIEWKQYFWIEDAKDAKDHRDHYCYRSEVFVDGVKKDIRAIKKSLKHLARDAADAMRKTVELVNEEKKIENQKRWRAQRGLPA